MGVNRAPTIDWSFGVQPGELEKAIVFASNAIMLAVPMVKHEHKKYGDFYSVGSVDAEEKRRPIKHLIHLQDFLEQHRMVIQMHLGHGKVDRTWPLSETWKVATLQTLAEIPSKLLELIDNIFRHFRKTKLQSFIGHRPNKMFSCFSLLSASIASMIVFVYASSIVKKFRSLSEEKVEKRTAELKQVLKDVEASSRQKSEFLAKISHEIRTSLTAVLGMTYLLRKTQLDDEQQEYTKILNNSGEFLLSMVSDILDYSKIEAGNFELEYSKFQLLQFIQETVQMVATSANQKGIRLYSDLRPTTNRTVLGDPKRLRQVLLNLLSNAIKFTDEGRVIIYADCRDGTNGTVLFDCTIRDTGIGIQAEAYKRLFNPFIQADSYTKDKREGTGLGLAISAQLIKSMAGSIDVTSEPGLGSTFRFTVNLKKDDAPGTRSKQGLAGFKMKVVTPLESTEKFIHGFNEFDDNARLGVPYADRIGQTGSHGERILLVEDNATNRLVTALILKSLGHAVSFARNGFEALEILSSTRYDLILMDCQMPELNGFEATRELRENERNKGLIPMPVIAMTAYAETSTRNRCLAAGMNDFLTKPITKAELCEIMDCWYFPEDSLEAADYDDLDDDVWKQLLQCQRSNDCDEDYIGTMCGLFLSDTRKRLDQLRSNLNSENLVSMSSELHRLAGGCRQLGALRMNHSCTDLQNRVDSKSLESCSHLLQRLEYEFSRVERLIVVFKKRQFERMDD